MAGTVAGALTLGGVMVAWAAPPPLPQGCTQTHRTVTCIYGPGTHAFAQPAGVDHVSVRVAGAAGGAGGANRALPGDDEDPPIPTRPGPDGGSGAVITGSLPLTAAGLQIVVGARGRAGAPTAMARAVVAAEGSRARRSPTGPTPATAASSSPTPPRSRRGRSPRPRAPGSPR